MVEQGKFGLSPVPEFQNRRHEIAQTKEDENPTEDASCDAARARLALAPTNDGKRGHAENQIHHRSDGDHGLNLDHGATLAPLKIEVPSAFSTTLQFLHEGRCPGRVME